MIVVVKKVGEKPTLQEVDKKKLLSELQHLVKGFIQSIPADDQGKYDLVVNEEGKINNLEPNFFFYGDVICGDAVLVRNNSEGDYISIPYNERLFALEYMKSFEKGQQNYV